MPRKQPLVTKPYLTDEITQINTAIALLDGLDPNDYVVQKAKENLTRAVGRLERLSSCYVGLTSNP